MTIEEKILKNKFKSSQEDILREQVLEKEKKQVYKSSKFGELEEAVKWALQRQSTDDALKFITLWALALGSSDTHYDNYAEKVSIRFRIDWVLVDIFDLSKNDYKKLLERLKYASGLKLNIVDIPQDGKYNMVDWDKKIDVRISTLPVKYGENIVCRILDSTKNIVNFEDLGFYWTTKRIVEKSIEKKNGLILVTGPTGSGKTTTLYTMLNKLNTREKKIATLEDPIEYEMPGIVQAEVNEKKWLTFENGLKALLRQDPDIIMVWEIRDTETLNIATSASLTGHLVLSTLHTKSAAETLDRIINMWLKPYVIASSLDTIIAQRLVRRICEKCKEEIKKTPEEEKLIESIMKDIWVGKTRKDNIKLYKWKWCEYCNHSWYKWRIWVYEIITLNSEIKNIIRDGGTSEEVIEEARKYDMITIKEDGILKSIKGYTTIEEVLRVIS